MYFLDMKLVMAANDVLNARNSERAATEAGNTEVIESMSLLTVQAEARLSRLKEIYDAVTWGE